MKTNFKRLFALLLTLCMLASLMVPVAFAEDEAVATPSANVAETYQIRLKDLTHTDPTTATGLDALAVVTGSQTGTTYKSGLSLGTAAIANAYPATLNWKFYATSSELIYRADQMWQARLSGWGAIQILVTEPGVYALNMTTDKANTAVEGTTWTNESVAWSGNVVAYIIPLSDVEAAIAAGTVTTEAEDGTVTTTAPTAAEIIPTLMTDKYSVGSDYLAAADTTVAFDEIRMDAGEYVVVYDADESAYSISEMSLVGDPYDVTEIANYQIRPFDPTLSPQEVYESGIPEYDSFVTATTDETTGETTYAYHTHTSSGSNYSGVSVAKFNTTAWYNQSGWKYYKSGSANFRPNYNWQLRVDAGVTVGFQVKVPASGFFALTAVSETSTATAEVYAINVNDIGDAAYTDLAVEANSLGIVGTANGAATTTSDTAYFEAGEYVILFKAVKVFALKSMSLIQYSGDNVVEGSDYTAKQAMTLGLYNISDPVFDQIVNGSTTFATELTGADGEATTLRAYTDALYAEGKLDWKIEGYASTFTDANFMFDTKNDRGFEPNTPDDSAKDTDWFALRFRVNQADYYSFSMKVSAATAPVELYLFSAASEAMTAEELAANMTPANGLHYQYKTSTNDQKISVGYLEGEYILLVNVPYNSSRYLWLNDIVLESEAPLSADDAQVFDFNMFNETSPYYSVVSNLYQTQTEEVTDPETGEVTTVTTFVPREATSINATGSSSKYVPIAWDAEGNPTELGNLYQVIFQADGSGYPNAFNWRPDAGFKSTTSDSTSAIMGLYSFADSSVEGTTDPAFKGATKETGASNCASVMIRVEKAGTYKLVVNGAYFGITPDVYFIDEFATAYNYTIGNASLKSYIEDEAQATLVKEDAGIKSLTANEIGEVTVDAAGDYVVAFAGMSAHTQFNGITLVPVVEEVVAGVAGETYATFEEAVAAATEGDTITLMDTVINGGDIVVPAGATLNLSGYSVYADVIDASAPGAKIVDPSDGGAALFADEVIFDEGNNNPQLPLKDKTTGAYHLFNVEVVSSATTGTGSATKYWFKVNFSNADALALIGSSTELRIMANMSGSYKNDGDGYAAGDPFAAVAYADAAFSDTWADNSNKYIVVYSVGSGINPFRLAPAVTANGVVISGTAMSKGN